MYKVHNNNLLYHGCIPMEPDGSFAALEVDGVQYRGKELLDYSDKLCRQGAFGVAGSQERRNGLDFMWFLWCGPKSPLNGKNKMTTFERYFIDDKDTWTETKDVYYRCSDDPEVAKRILKEFGIDEEEFKSKLPKIAELAVGDACTGSNPRPITPAEMEKLLTCTYYGTEVDF